MFEIKKHSLLGIISLILAIIVIIIITIEFVMVVIASFIPGDWGLILFISFNDTFFLLLFLTIITTIVGIITKVVKKDRFGMWAILIGILCFIFNWVLLLIALSKLDF